MELQRQMFARCKELEQVIKFQRETIQDQVSNIVTVIVMMYADL